MRIVRVFIILFSYFFRDNSVPLDPMLFVPTNGCSFATFKQNVDADMCMAVLLFDGEKWEYAAMPYRTRDVAEQLGVRLESVCAEVRPFNNDSIPVKNRWYQIVYSTAPPELFPEAKHWPYGEFIRQVIAKSTREILDGATQMRTSIDYVFNKRKLVGKSPLHFPFYV